MKKLGVLLSMLLLTASLVSAGTTESIDLLASKLVLEQAEDGSWPDEADWTGTLAAGMLKAAAANGEADYSASATKALDFILNSGCCDYFGDELYAMSLNEETVPVVKAFFELVRAYGTWEYIGFFGIPATSDGDVFDRSTAIFYMSHITVAAYNVNAKDKGIFRQALTQIISEATDKQASFPVLSLCTGTWALASTGKLDDTPIFNTNKKLKNLPGMVLSHQVPADAEGQGSFFWRIDHGKAKTDFASGYTDEAVYGTMALVAIYKNDMNKYANFKDAIALAQGALMGGIADDGSVKEHLSKVGEDMHGYGAKVIQALAACDSVLK